MTDAPPTVDSDQVPAPAVVTTDGGPVTLVDMDGLNTALASARAKQHEHEQEAQSLSGLAAGLWTQRGRLLLAGDTRWPQPPSIAPLVASAKSLDDQVHDLDARLAEMQAETHTGLSGIVAKATEWNEHRKLVADRANLDGQLRTVLIQLGRQSPEVTLPDADIIGSQAKAADLQAQQALTAAADSGSVANTFENEVQRRTEAQSQMGFDSLYLAAYLQTHGPEPVQRPLVLKRGEQAYVSVAATLARQQTRRQWVGGSQGFSFPIGHTGIRYRVGSYRGHPVEQQFLARLDSGTLVVTNQRVAFIGSTKSVSTVLSKILHVECYSDGVAIFQEGRENPDYYFQAQPKYVLFFINWFLAKSST